MQHINQQNQELAVVTNHIEELSDTLDDISKTSSQIADNLQTPPVFNPFQVLIDLGTKLSLGLD